MKIIKAYLIGLGIWRTSKEGQTNLLEDTERLGLGWDERSYVRTGSDRWLELPHGRIQQVTYLGKDGEFISSRFLGITKSAFHEYWRETVKQVFLPAQKFIGNYLHWECYIKLDTLHLDHFLSGNKMNFELQKRIDDLFDSIFKMETYSQIFPYKYLNYRYSYVLYLEIDTDVRLPPEKDENLTLFLEEAKEKFGTSSCLPSSIDGALLFPGPSSASSYPNSLIVQFNKVANTSNRSITLPVIVKDMCNFYNWVNILGDVSTILKNLPFATRQIENYFRKFTTIELSNSTGIQEIIQKNNSKNSMSFLKEYQNIYLIDKQLAFRYRVSCEKLMNEFNKEMKGNFIYNLIKSFDREIDLVNYYVGNISIRDGFKTPAESFLYDINFEIQEKVNQTHELIEAISSNENALADYFRDMADTSTTITNIKLQQTMKELTWVAIIIALISLFVAIPQEVKNNFWLFLTKILH